MYTPIHQKIKEAEKHLQQLKEIEQKYQQNPMLELEDKIREMRFLNSVSAKNIIDVVILWHEKNKATQVP